MVSLEQQITEFNNDANRAINTVLKMAAQDAKSQGLPFDGKQAESTLRSEIDRRREKQNAVYREWDADHLNTIAADRAYHARELLEEANSKGARTLLQSLVPSQAGPNAHSLSQATETSAQFTETFKATMRNVLSGVEKSGARPDVVERKVREISDANRDGKLDDQERKTLIDAVGQSNRLRKALDLNPDASRAVEQIKEKLRSAGVAPTSPGTSAAATNANASAGRSDKGPPQVGG